jgi:hypothetical protein
VSRLGDLVRRPAEKMRRGEPAPAPVGAPKPVVPEPAKPEPKELIAQRDRMLEKFTVMQADIGGAFYEMAIRDHVRLDVLTRKAAELQRVDAELTALERLLEVETSDAAGHCPTCGSPFGHGVRFCDQCGSSLSASAQAAPVAAATLTPAPPVAAPPPPVPVASPPVAPQAPSPPSDEAPTTEFRAP